MIGRKDILPIPYLKKAAFTGSHEGMRFRFALVQKELPPEEGAGHGKGVQALEVTAWEGPYGFDATPEEEKQRLEADFSEEGIEKGIAWLNGLWEQDKERWQRAKTNWKKARVLQGG